MSLLKKKATAETEMTPNKRRHNLLMLAFLSVLIPVVTSSISLYFYRTSGDIYLDRSRPGFIEEGEKHNEEDDGKEQFSSDGEITAESLDEYLEQLKIIEGRLEDSGNDFDARPLSDEALGIPEE